MKLIKGFINYSLFNYLEFFINENNKRKVKKLFRKKSLTSYYESDGYYTKFCRIIMNYLFLLNS